MSKTEEMAPPVPAHERSHPPRIDERYRIEKEIGRGGMGRVFVAHDRKLGRDVAIKVLASGLHGEEALRRFEQEARATCALNHANILDVHDIGTCEGSPYIVSELLHGTTLRECLRERPLSVQEASGYALQLAQGLSAAHEKGIVHRDLKPENLFITEEGRLKILDFGIAKLVAPMTLGTGETLPSPQPHTEDGAILGTVGYMSPEQVRGQPADQRSDVFAFGAIVYEMLAGRSPFERDTAVETGYAILNDDPPPLPTRVSPQLDRVVRRCLEKAPERRFKSARDLAFLLETLSASGAGELRAPSRATGRRWAAIGVGGLLLLSGVALLVWGPFRLGTAVPAAERKSVAVLPFVNMSGDKDSEYFSDGMTEELINALANVEGLQVTARTSAFAFKGKNLDVREIGAKLDVGTVVEGTVRREGNRLRISAQLVNAAHGYHLWSMTYDRELKNIFAVEEELARSIVQALKAKLVQSGAEPLVRPGTTNLAAHDLYLKGQYFWNKRTAEALTKAIAYFQQAIENDRAYPLAYVGLGMSTAILVEYGSASAEEAFPKARQAVLKALELDSALAEAHTSLGMISHYNFEWDAAAQEYQRAIELKPEYPTAHHSYSILLTHLGRVEEARAEAERARQLDPTSLVININVAETLYAAREYDRAIEQAKKTLELDPDFLLAHSYLALAYLSQNRYADAVAELEKLRAHSATFPSRYAGELGYAYAMSGRRAEALRLLAELKGRSEREHVSPSAQALIYMGLGDKNQAFAWLDKAYAERDWRMRQLKSIPLWDNLRSDPRFTPLLKKMHLE